MGSSDNGDMKFPWYLRIFYTLAILVGWIRGS